MSVPDEGMDGMGVHCDNILEILSHKVFLEWFETGQHGTHVFLHPLTSLSMVQS